MMGRFLVTGCAGFIGSHLTERLLRDGHQVCGVDRFTDYYPRSRKEANMAAFAGSPRFSFLELDLATDPLDHALSGVSGVFHLAAQPGVRGSWGGTFAGYVHDNVLATQRLLEAAAARAVRVAFASSSSVYGDALEHPTAETCRTSPISPYGVTKLCCEQLATAYQVAMHLDVVALRYFTVYGPRQRPDMAFSRLLDSLASGVPFPVYGDGSQSRDFTFVSDAVEATVAAFESGRPGATYNVGGGTEASLAGIIGLVQELAGANVALEFREAAAGDVRRTTADTSRLRADTGWVPRTSLEEGLGEQVSATLGQVGESAAVTAR